MEKNQGQEKKTKLDSSHFSPPPHTHIPPLSHLAIRLCVCVRIFHSAFLISKMASAMRSQVLGASVPFHANPDNLNTANQPAVRIATVPTVKNQFIVHFANRDPIFGNLMEKELSLMGVKRGILHVSCTMPNFMEQRILMRITVKSGVDVRILLRECISQIRCKFIAMRVSYEAELLRVATNVNGNTNNAEATDSTAMDLSTLPCDASSVVIVSRVEPLRQEPSLDKFNRSLKKMKYA